MVQLTFCPVVAVQFQPVPVGVPMVRPAGTGSVTVTCADVGPGPALLTVSVKFPVLPTATVLVAGVLVMDRDGDCTPTVTVADAMWLVGSPPPDSVAVFVTVVPAML